MVMEKVIEQETLRSVMELYNSFPDFPQICVPFADSLGRDIDQPGKEKIVYSTMLHFMNFS